MSCENRLSLIDGRVEEVKFPEINLAGLSVCPDPMEGAVKEKKEVFSLVDGTVEEIEVVVLPPFPVITKEMARDAINKKFGLERINK